MSCPDPLYDYEDFDMDRDYDWDDIDIENVRDDHWGDDYDESMDGDHDSAMTSAGWGTDEDYGHYDDYEDFHSDDGFGYYGEE